MKIFLITVACIIGWFVCAVLSALIGKKFFDFEEGMVVFCACLAPLILAIELIAIPFALLYDVICIIVYRKR